MEKISVAEWGPDMQWTGYLQEDLPDKQYDFIATGKTYRDYTPLIECAHQSLLDGIILNGSTMLKFSKGNQTVTEDRPRLENDEVMLEIAASEVVVIPVRDPKSPKGLTGLTELADAIAMGVPVVMTRNELMPVDIDARGIGTTVEKNATPEDLYKAIAKARLIPSDRVRAVSQDWNEALFREKMLTLFDDLLRAGKK
ncbi:hypothetical protein AAIH25_10925 [Arthrobacter crystallopoietes]|uniref:glycosyltransferase n=1 Tax=Crystallibacter crystallopoietes TaxID=37928 RepID=UPI003D221C5E